MGKGAVAKKSRQQRKTEHALRVMQEDFDYINKKRDEEWQTQVDNALAAMTPVFEESTFVELMNLFLLVLHDKFQFGKQRLTRFADEVLELFETMNAGYVSLDDMRLEIKRITGHEFLLTYEEQHKMWHDRCDKLGIRIIPKGE